MKVFAITLLVLIGFLSFSYAELTPNFPGNQPLVIDGSTPVNSNTTTNVTTEPKTVLDNFDVFQQPLVIELRNPAPPTVTATQFAQSSSILGGERDLILTALTGTTGRVFSASISDSQFSIATPNGANGEAQLQYDGIDGSATLDTSPGLGGVDLTFGNAKGFQISATTDLTTQYKITAVSGDGGSGTVTNSVPGTEGTVFFQYQIPFSSFTGVDFANIVAIQITVDALDNVDFIMESFVTYGDVNVISEGGSHVEGSVLPCTADYYNVKTLTGLTPGNYIRISFNQSGEASHPTDLGSFYIVASPYTDLESELSSNVNIIDTLGQLPGPHNYLYACEQVSECEIEITCQLEETTYYIAVAGGQQGVVNYEFDILLRQAEVFELFDCVSQPVIDDRRATQPPDDRTLYYRFFAIDIPKANYGEGTYLVVNVSRSEPFPIEFRLSFDGLPGYYGDTGNWDTQDYDSDGNLVDDCTFQYCVDTTDSPYTHPVNTDPRIPCVATTSVEYFFPGGPYQLTAKLTVDPCEFQYGVWYAAIYLPPRVNVTDPLDTSGNENYTITACVITPTVTELDRNITFKGYVEPEQQTHYKIVVPEESVVPGETHLFIQVSNIRNGYVDIWVHNDVGGIQNLAGGPEGCLPANATCHTCDACNIVIEKCHFTPGTWYISLSIGVDSDGNFEVVDYDRLPITYTIRADWMEDSAPITLYSGIPVSRAIGASLYDFYVIDIPPTVDTWLFIELFTKACDTEVIISVLHGALPGGECYARPDFYCLTGDPRDITYTTPQYGEQVTQIPKQRESCTFMIQTCELEAGPLYISVYGQRTNYAAYGDTTYYQIPAHYTLFVDFEVAKALHSGVSLTETIYQNQYKHYYIRADQILEGSYMSVEITNIQHGVPQTVELFVNYNYLAGDCPCYEHLYNATGAQLPGCNGVVPSNEPNFIPQPNTVATCATIIVPACDFRPGVWYVSVKGINQDLVQYTTPIGYTLTVTVHDAPVFHPLILGQSTPGSVVQWNKTLEYTNYKLGASPLPLTDLVFKLTYVQNCEYQAKHDNLRDQLVMFVNADGPAGDKCWDQRCVANVQSESYCTVVIPNCQWQSDDYFVAIKGDYDADFPGRYTVRASLEEVRFYQLSSGVSVYDRVSQYLYKHYYIVSTGAIGKYLAVDFYTNNDQDLVSVYLNAHEPAGASPCYSNINSCIKKNACAFQVETCDIEAGRYYISVYGEPHQFYDISVEYTLTASLRPLTTALGDGNPLTGSVRAGGVVHYKIEVDSVSDGDFLTFEIDNVQHGSVVVYYQFESVAGRCPCYLYEYSCYADSANTEWCEIRVPSCEFSAGIHYFSIVGLKNKSPSALACNTAIGYTIEANVVKPNIIEPTVVVGRFTEYTELFQFVANGRYNHYQFDFTQEDYDSGYHVIVEITSVRDGALFVYFTPDFPGDEATDCHLAKLCTSGLGSGKSCYWQVPFSLTKPRYDKAGNEYSTLFITVEGRTGRLQASYNILIYKQPVPEIIANPAFTLDNVTSSLNFPAGAEVNITHFKVDEPNGWTQFIKLANVSGHTDPLRGEILEVFIYRIINNFLEPMSFNVYLFPERPAGAHECCDPLDSNLGSCQGAPTLTTVQLTTQVYGDSEDFSYTADLPTGVGNGPTNQPFFGQNLTVRVWPCEYTRYCANVSDWWLAIVPIAATDASSTPLQGLSYSVQYRTRNIRLDEVYQVGSIDLTQYVNTYLYTPDYTVRSFTTEDQGWLSFVLDFSSTPFSGRLSIETVIVNGSSIVYINPNGFAAPPSDLWSGNDETFDKEECSQYCYTNQFFTYDCDLDGRFLATTCNLQDVYFITVRNIGGPNTFSSVRFRIVAVYDTEPTIVPMHTTQSSPFIATSGNSVFNIPGLEGEAYDFYTFPIDDGDIADFQSLIIDLNRDVPSIPLNDTGVLNVYVRLGSAAGDYDGTLYNGVSETCYGWDYRCSNVGPQERCILQIPSKQLTQGFWSISVYNPNFDYTIPADLPQYQLSLYLQDPPTALTLGIPYIQANSSLSYVLPTTFTFFQFTVTESDIAFTSEEINGSYYTKYLRVAVQGISTTESFPLYGDYGRLAGSRTINSYAFSLTADQTRNCGEDDSCYYDIVPCSSTNDDEFKLKTGVYFIALYLNAPTTYNLTVSIRTFDFTVLSPVATAGTGKRAALTDYVWSATPTNLDRTNNTDGHYRYALNTADSGVTDLTNYYFIVNITIPSANQTYSANLKVWRDDCSQFSTSVSEGSYAVIDAISLAPCSVTPGRYYFDVYTANAAPFTLTFTQTSTFTQTLLNNQIFVDEIYPYEYDEYFFPSAADVHQGATLSVRVCALCGDVEAWIKEDTPAGPTGGDFPECAIDYCAASAGAGALFDDDADDNCCVLFLDNCEYKQRGYYIAVRGVGTEFPNSVNSHLLLPALYQLQATQTNIQVHDISLGCGATVEYQQPVNQVPQQFAVDIESLNLGAQLRFTMLVPTEYISPVDGVASVLSIALNQEVGYTSECGPAIGTCNVLANSGNYVCDVVLSSCQSVPGRYYIWADAPRGTEIYVERWDPVIPLIHTDIQYSATINAPSDHIEVPFSPAVQYYRFDYPDYVLPDDDDDYDHFYDKFFIRVRVTDVSHGSISVVFNTGYAPYDTNSACLNQVNYATPLFLNTESCTVATDGYDCYIDIQRSDINFVEHQTYPPIPKTFWITVIGTEQQCELHSIQYSFIVQTQWVITYFNLDTTICESVEEKEYNFHRLRPHAAETPQQSYLSFSITDIDAVDGEEIELLIEDNYLPTLDTATFSYRSGRYGSTRDSTAPAGSINVNWYCSYDNLYFSTYGINSADGEIDYRLNVTKVYVDVKELFNNHVYHADDDDDDACPHEHDFYIFKAIAPNGGYKSSFLRVSVDSEGPTTVYINKGGFAWEQCNVAYDSSDRGTLNVYDFCTYEDTTYYITVVSSGPYYIYTNVIDTAVALTLGEVYRDTLEPGQYKMYTLEICKDYLNPDDRLTVEIADVQGSSIEAFIQRDSNAGPECQLPGPRSFARAFYGSDQSGYDFILVNHCYLVPGTYHILVNALGGSDDSDNNYDDDDVNQEAVSFRIFPRLKNYGVTIANLTLGVALPDVVDYFTVDRYETDSLERTKYYRVTPLFTKDVYENGISFGQVRISNINGGGLNLNVNKERLASFRFGYIPGSITDLTHQIRTLLPGNIQSGHYPYINQFILDREPAGNPQFSCRNGCSDYCDFTTDILTFPFDVYNTDRALALWIPSCYWDISLPLYIAVETYYQSSERVPVTYDVQVDQYVDFPLLQPNINQVASMTNDNWEYHFYRTIQPEVQSARWRVVVTDGEGVFINVYNNRCPYQATWSRELWCDASYFDRPWMCEIEIPTAAAHPGNNAFFITVKGKNATYSIAYWRGRENCQNLYGDGQSQGLDFCAGLVPYTTWRWDDYSKLDNEAQCFFEELYEHFRVQPCWSGVTTDCNATLQRFACYESFRRCDEYGFYVGTCRKACNAVVYECVNWFESVNLEHYNCSSSRYIDEGAYTCTGSDEFETFVTNTKLFFPRDPKLILYEAENPDLENSSSVLTLSVSLVLALLALVL